MNVFKSNLQRIEEIKKLEGLRDEEIAIFLSPVESRYAELELDGRKYPAWRVVYSRDLGPGKGGIRFHPEVSEDKVKSLSFWMALKNSLANIPYGGAKGGIKIDPKVLNKNKLEEISRQYVRQFSDFLGQDKDIPAPDVYTNSQTMSWMLDEFEKIKKHHEPGMITGKPIELGGVKIRQDATAQGGYLVLKEMVTAFLSKKSDLSIAIQGFGNAGSLLAEKLFADGFRIVAVSDSSGGIYNQAGLDIKKLKDYKKLTGNVSTYNQGERISNQDFLELKVDILVLAALENQITDSNANKIKADFLLELANGPIDFAADNILSANNKLVVPDILANSGGVIASYFEWAQNKTGQILDEDYLCQTLDKKMRVNWHRVYQKYIDSDKKISLRQAAYSLAMNRIIEAARYRGRIKD